MSLHNRLLYLVPLFLFSFSACLMDEKFIFFPSAVIEATPKDYGADYEDIYFTTADGVRLNGWLVLSPGAKATLLWFHGNGGNIGDRARGAQMLREKINANIFIIDYRGYGRSEGSASEAGTYEDARAALRYLSG